MKTLKYLLRNIFLPMFVNCEDFLNAFMTVLFQFNFPVFI